MAIATGGLIDPADFGDYLNLVANWPTWSPTYTNITAGNGTTVARYVQTGKTVEFIWSFTLGSTSAVTGNPIFSLPANVHSSIAAFTPLGLGHLFDTGINDYQAICVLGASAGVARLRTWNVGATYPTAADVTATVPFTFGLADTMFAHGRYEVA